MSFLSHIWQINSKTLFQWSHINLSSFICHATACYNVPPNSFKLLCRMPQRGKHFGHATMTFSRTCWNRYTFYLSQTARIDCRLCPYLSELYVADHEPALTTATTKNCDMHKKALVSPLVPRSVVTWGFAENISVYEPIINMSICCINTKISFRT